MQKGSSEMNKDRTFAGKGSTLPRKRTISVAVASLLSLAAASVTAQSPGAVETFTIDQGPYALGKMAEPNLMYIHDDSGSMGYEYMPDKLTTGTNAYVNHNYNKIYYNPEQKYRLPVDHDGKPLPMPTFKEAWRDGYAHYQGLTTTKTDLSGTSSSWTVAKYIPYISAGSPNNFFTGRRAFYSEHNKNIPSCAPNAKGVYPSTSSCYTLKPLPADQEDNFAIWFSYYRNRNMTAKAGISLGFDLLDGRVRVGYARINYRNTKQKVDGLKALPAFERGVRRFSGDERKEFYKWLFGVPASGSTPLRAALHAAGMYYELDSDQGPWSSTPGTPGGTLSECRRSYTLMMSDGYWNEIGGSISAYEKEMPTYGGAAVGDTDKHKATSSNTLADIAYHFWKKDLAPNLDNALPPTARNPNTHQHMVTYTVGLGVNGTITEADILAKDSDPAKIVWPVPDVKKSDDPEKIDDMVHAALNSAGGFYQANNADEFESALKSILSEIQSENSAVAPAALNSGRLASGSLAYMSDFDSVEWSSDIYALKYNKNLGKFSDRAWTAADKLPAYGSRKIFTYQPDSKKPSTGKGIPFKWTSLSAEQRALLPTVVVDTSTKKSYAITGEEVLNWVRGDQSKEKSKGGHLRSRTTLIGDVINAGLTYVSNQSYGYAYSGGLTKQERQEYMTRLYSSNFTNRPGTVYVGANDGMLHAFSGSNGVERFAYIPNGVIKHLKELVDPAYAHHYFVDATPRVADAYINGWKTILVGSTGAGGNVYFALDIENPLTFSEKNVLWEFSHPELGVALGRASIVKTRAGKWVAIFGNGYNSGSEDGDITKYNRARLFVVDLASGEVIRVLDTKAGSDKQPNGLASPLVVDVDQDGVADIAYAGDHLGNMWKFDLTSPDSKNWNVAFNGKPLFQAKDKDGKPQPITAAPAARNHPRGGVMVYFGTGSNMMYPDRENFDVQSIYAIQDECGMVMSGSRLRDSDTGSGATVWCGAVSTDARVPSRDYLQQQTIVHQDSFLGYDVRFTSGDSTPNYTKLGFFMDLVYGNVQEGERVIMSPTVELSDRVMFSSVIAKDSPCESGLRSWVMTLDPVSGGNPQAPVYDLNFDGSFDESDTERTKIVKDGKGKEKTVDWWPAGVGSQGGSDLTLGQGDDDSWTTMLVGGKVLRVQLDRGLGRQSWLQMPILQEEEDD